MRYYISNDLLIKENPETKTFKVCNRTNKINVDKYIITPDEFSQMEKKQLKISKFGELLNNWFREIKHEWVHEHTNYKKIDNFEADEHHISKNYILGKDVPYHKLDNFNYRNVIFVYYHGHVYYHTISYGGFPQGQLVDIKTLETVKWTRLKNCSPVFNINTKKIC